jgi:hypothetical protein
MGWLSRLFSRSPRRPQFTTRRTTHDNPLVIPGPRLGFWNLLGASATPIINEDHAALAPLFAATIDGGEAPPPCDVLLLYCRLEPDGRIAGSNHSLREAIWKARACITVVASENSPESYIAASKRPGLGRANLVMTLARRGNAFPSFFRSLFGAMKEGMTMPMAWVELAPQIPGQDHENCPGTIFACEAGHIAFGVSARPTHR